MAVETAKLEGLFEVFHSRHLPSGPTPAPLGLSLLGNTCSDRYPTTSPSVLRLPKVFFIIWAIIHIPFIDGLWLITLCDTVVEQDINILSQSLVRVPKTLGVKEARWIFPPPLWVC